MDRKWHFGLVAAAAAALALASPITALAQSTALTPEQRMMIDQRQLGRDLTYVGPLIVNGVPQGPAGYHPQVKSGIPQGNLAPRSQPFPPRSPSPTLPANSEVKIVTPSAHAFDQADTNRDGKVDREEFRTLRRAKTEAAWKAADKNGDGVLTPTEFMAPYPAQVAVGR